ncbi:unnamed protein product, partial [Brenthis ino]
MLNIYYQNFRGINTKLDDIRLATLRTNYDLIVATETWLNESVMDSELFSEDFNIYRRDRQSTKLSTKRGGGVLFAVSKKYISRRIEHYESAHEDLWINIKLNNSGMSKNILVCVLYLPPPVVPNTLNLILDNISSNLQSYQGEVLILGDFNLGFTDWSCDINNCNSVTPRNYGNLLGYALIDFISLHNLTQYNCIRNDNGRVLDLVLANFDNIKVSKSLDVLSKLDPHHPPLDVEIIQQSNSCLNSIPFATHAFKKADYNKVNSELRRIDWVFEFRCSNDVNVMVETFYRIINKVTTTNNDTTIPKLRPKTKRHPVWFTHSLIKLIREKENIRRRLKTYNNPRDKLELSLAKSRTESLMNACFSEYISDTEKSIARNPKKTLVVCEKAQRVYL